MGLGGKRGFMHVILYGQSVCPDWCIWIFNREIKETYKILKENNVYCLLFMLVMTCELWPARNEILRTFNREHYHKFWFS